MADEDAREEALRAARRVYDRQVAELENIDDGALRTSRTAVLILGFVAAALTATGPTAARQIRPLPLLIITFGGIGVFTSTFLGISVYNITSYRNEVDGQLLKASTSTPAAEWRDRVLDRLDDANSELASEVERNGRYLEVAQLALLAGVGALVYGTSMVVIHRSFGISPVTQGIAWLIFLATLIGIPVLINLGR
jgi:hypothetical protein